MTLKEFIEKYREEINNKEFEEVYSSAEYELFGKDTGRLTELFYKCGVNPLDFMGYVPAGYAYDSNIDKVTIPVNIKSIRDFAFLGCKSLTSITIPNSVTSIGDYAFSKCTSLTSVNISNSVKSIDGCVFKGCTSLTSVTIGDSVTSIGNWAFDECTSLKTINYNGTRGKWKMINLYHSWDAGSSLETIHCLDGDINL